MNTKNNRRRRESIHRIESAFLQLLQEKELEQLTVAELCKECGLNRSTFYANFMDIYDLADHMRKSLEAEVTLLYRDEQERAYNSNNFLKLFRHIQENQILYRTYFKLGYADQLQMGGFQYDTHLARQYFDDQFVQYHLEFFRQGFNAIVKMWLMGGCRESPEDMAQIIRAEYQGRGAL